MHGGASDSYLKEVPKSTNKLEATLSIIKADFSLRENIFWGRWRGGRLWYSLEAFIKVSDVERVIDIFRKLAVRTTYSLPSGPSSLRSVSLFLPVSYFYFFSFLSLSIPCTHTHTHIYTHTLCPVHFQFDLFNGFLSQLSRKIQLIEPCCEISLRSGYSRFSECGPCSSAHICMMHRVQNVNRRGTCWFMHVSAWFICSVTHTHTHWGGHFRWWSGRPGASLIVFLPWGSQMHCDMNCVAWLCY